jgi:hypothetical protein
MEFTIFVSHAHDDADIIGELSAVIDHTLDDIDVRSSSARPSAGGIEPGSSWLEWIYESVTQSSATLVILTEASYRRPWLLWEAGAVSGVSMSLAERKPIVPVLFGISSKDIPGPLRHLQVVDGRSAEGINDLLRILHRRVQRPSPAKFDELLRLKVPNYLRAVSKRLRERQDVTPASEGTGKAFYDRTYQGEDLDLNLVNFTSVPDPEDTSGTTITNNPGDWMIEIDVESPLRSERHTVEIRYRRRDATGGGRIELRVESGELTEHREVIDMANVRYHKYVMEYLTFRHNSRIAKVVIRPLDEEARREAVFCLDSVSVYSIPHGG